jgi:predicted transcriptional regulator
MNIEEIRRRLNDLSWSQLESLAGEAGVSFHTLRKIATGETADPRMSTADRLRAYLERKSA